MKALSIRQPWAWLICRPDLTTPVQRAFAASSGTMKDIENRDWSTTFRGRFLIHASQGMSRAEYDQCALFVETCVHACLKLPAFEALERGGIVGEAELVDVVDDSCSWWFFGHYGFVLRDQRPLPFRPCRGALKFFEVPDLCPSVSICG
jgi:hypothetical protein